MIFGRRFAADPQRWLVVDVEASGLDAARDRLLAIAGVALAVDGAATPRITLGDSFEVVLGQGEVAADKQNILVHGIGVGAQRAGLAPAQALAAFEHWIGRSPLLAFHSGFDETLLRRALRGVLGRVPKNPWLDLAPLAQVAWPERRGVALDDWLSQLSIECLARHQAAADSLATAELLLAMWPVFRARGAKMDFASLAKLAADVRWLARR